MGARKRLAAEKRKEANKSVCQAKAVGVPTSPRKMRLLADVIRGREVFDALNILTFSTKHASKTLEKLLRSGINNWQEKFNAKADESGLYVKAVTIDSGRILKRFQPAPQGRAYRIRKRSNHITIQLASRTIENAELATEE
ncbi:MAG TPA: 50S ribosomal protein L22 [Chitinophagales bacterium]|jgi:large subunit ribosomal protein L22|nr:50S ribosomal protein L22 [Chitinophagales bacterium]HQD12208.1 50S ribosomal protein L22 [Chitinophagales bacterium]HQO30813.1 50S ribosomal protein L22 [Chitinophagales bacterium]HQO88304.1 50S ribosomal protein L22 [Chitinophagales bacterium]